MKKKIVRFINSLDVHDLIAGGVIAVFIMSCIVQCVLLEQIDSKIDRIEAAMNQPAAVSEIEIPVSETDSEPKEDFVEIVSLGEFELTAYCGENYPHICNDGDPTRTATGTRPEQGRTIAVDSDVIPYGTEVIINGHVYIAEDCGGDINAKRIDIFFDSHQDALNFGRQTAEVFQIISEG